MRACLSAPPWCQTADHLPTRLLGAFQLALVPALCTPITLFLRQLSQSRGRRFWYVESHETRWVTRAESRLERGYRKQAGEYTLRAGPNGGAHLLALALCLSLPNNSWANLPQSAAGRTCLLPASGTAGKRVGERLKCYMWKGKWPPLPWEVTRRGVTSQVWKLTGLLLPAELSMKSVRWYHLRLTVMLAKSHNEDMVIATSQVKVASHRVRGRWKKLCWPKCSFATLSISYTITLSWQSTCFRLRVRLHVWPLMNLLFLSCV